MQLLFGFCVFTIQNRLLMRSLIIIAILVSQIVFLLTVFMPRIMNTHSNSG